jgi:hypothetical protein
MTINAFLVLLTGLATLTSLFTEAVKKLLDESKIKYASNIVVLVSAVVVGGLGMVSFYLLNEIEFILPNIIGIILMVVSNWLVAMLGYDKVVQAIQQLKGGK